MGLALCALLDSFCDAAAAALRAAAARVGAVGARGAAQQGAQSAATAEEQQRQHKDDHQRADAAARAACAGGAAGGAALAAAEEIEGEEELKLYFAGNSLDEQVEYVIGADAMDVDETLVREALKLKTGEFSDIFTTEAGTTFLYCVNDSDEEAIRLRKQEMILDSQREAFAEQYAAWRDEVTVKKNDSEINAFLEKIADE